LYCPRVRAAVVVLAAVALVVGALEPARGPVVLEQAEVIAAATDTTTNNVRNVFGNPTPLAGAGD
jgi:hypothetical protein